ncbi:Aste57867_1529 [Aphanomyces stellatus]|uniref:Aste57867_1529 protein n=1 Tax=Aphanomyces stellatus TaxID=120398 RepID=A0A485K5V9_9STRA|nr:hypothetical protein As57867_001528 [Aphanomyces stellatus]VFT78744.1 Aste57867_1529 [Aphanomyces stellatus]
MLKPVPTACTKVVEGSNEGFNASTTSDVGYIISNYPENATALLCSSVDCIEYLKTWTDAPACTLGETSPTLANMARTLLAACPTGLIRSTTANTTNATIATPKPTLTTAKSPASYVVVGVASVMAAFAMFQ